MKKSLNLDLLKKILSTPGISGHEYKVTELLKKELEPYATSINTDSMGNLIVFKKSYVKDAPRLAFSAHIDEIGLMVRHIDSSGFIRINAIGGVDARTIICQRVTILGKEPIQGIIGTKPIHIMKPEELKIAPTLRECFIDTGLSEKEVKEKVSLGDPIVRIGEPQNLGSMFISKSMDNRVSVFSLVEAIKEIKKSPYNLFFIFCTQEEVGLRGIRIAASSIQPDLGINIDVGLANDVPDVPEHDHGLKLGKGPGINILDATCLSHPGFNKQIEEIAKSENILIQHSVCSKGGTDAAGLQYLSLSNCICTGLSIPLRYMHSPVETAHLNDVKDTISLIKAIASSSKLKNLLAHYN